MFFRRRQAPNSALHDAELYERVRAIAHEELESLIAQGRVRFEAQADDISVHADEGEEGTGGGELRLTPTRPGTTGIAMSIHYDTVGFGAGEAGGSHEIWSTADADWESTLRQLIRCVRDGRYSERVRSGWFFPLKVEMRFGGVSSRPGRRRRRPYTVSYASTLASVDLDGCHGELPMPATGEFRYEPW